MRRSVAGFIALAACREATPPRSVRPRPLEGVLRATSPASDATAQVDAGVTAEVRGLEEWVEVAPGLRWRRATVRFEGRSPSPQWPMAVTGTFAWVVLRVDLSLARLSVEHMAGDSTLLEWRRSPRTLAIVNAGFFEPSLRPSGLVVAAGACISRAGPRGGSGVLVVRDGRADVVAADVPGAGEGAVAAVQCGPRLVERGGVAGIYRDDRQFYARTAACVRDGGRTLDLIAVWDVREALRGPGLWYFSRMLAGPSPVGDTVGCELALNLDGGPSTAMFVRGADGGGGRGGMEHPPIGPTPWAFVLR